MRHSEFIYKEKEKLLLLSVYSSSFSWLSSTFLLWTVELLFMILAIVSTVRFFVGFFVVKIWPVWKGIENLAPIHKVVSIFDLSATARRRAITNNFYGGRRELDGASGSRQTCLSIRGVTRRRIWRFCFEEKKIGKRPARVKDRIDVIPIGEQQTRGRRVRCVTFLTLVQGKRSEWQLSPGCQDGHKLVNTCLYRLVCCISSYLTRTSIAARREYELVGDRVLGPSTVACV